MTRDEFHDYLHYGYCPARITDELVAEWREVVEQPLEVDGDYRAWVRRGTTALASAFENTEGALHVVPLSGGLDSRLILAELLAQGLSDRLVAVTVGSPGTYDYDLGRHVAYRAGVRHVAIDLSLMNLTVQDIERAAVRVSRPVWLPAVVFLGKIYDEFGVDAVYWSGFFGDPISGSHLLAEESRSWEKACRRFAARNCMSSAIRLTPPGYDPVARLPATAPLGRCRLSFDEQLDFLIRQECYIRPTVVPPGFSVRTPFLNLEWRRFMVNAPRTLRRGQRLYRDVFRGRHPFVFSLPTKRGLGLPEGAHAWRRATRRCWLGLWARLRRRYPGLRVQSDPRLNYVDLDECLRERTDYRDVIGGAVQDLKDRSILDWFDTERLWQAHGLGRINAGDAITLLASLEFFLKLESRYRPR